MIWMQNNDFAAVKTTDGSATSSGNGFELSRSYLKARSSPRTPKHFAPHLAGESVAASRTLSGSSNGWNGLFESKFCRLPPLV